MSDPLNLSRTIAAHMAAMRRAEIPQTALHAARRSLVDALGVMLAASGLAEDAAPYRAQADGLAGPCRLIGSGKCSALAAAALANGALAHALDFGDTFDAGPAHPNAALVPALMAIADVDPSIGAEQFFRAMVAGSDLACRLSLAPARPFEEGGWYPPPLVNLVATAAAVAMLLNLPEDGIRHAMGLALMQGSFPGEIKYDPTSPARGVREGFAARGAVEAAMLARSGARAFEDPLGGKAGFFAVFGGGPAKAALLEQLGDHFLNAEVSFKPWPACRGTHAYIEAALQLRGAIGNREFRSIEAEIGPVQQMLIAPLAAKQKPQTPIEARFSIPYTVAVALADGAVTLDSFIPDRLADPVFASIAAKVAPRLNDRWGRAEAASGSLRIVMSDGAVLGHAVPHAVGHPDRPISDAALIGKFVDCASRALRQPPAGWAEDFAVRMLAGDLSSPSRWLLWQDLY